MASNAGIFFAGMGTTFLILGAGFGGGLMMAKSALQEPTRYQTQSSAILPLPARVILPSTAEAAQPPQPPQQVETAREPLPAVQGQPMKEAQAAVEKQVDKKVDTKKAEVEQRERRTRYAERKAKRQAERAKRQIEQRVPQEAPVMAFGGDEPRFSGGFFGN